MTDSTDVAAAWSDDSHRICRTQRALKDAATRCVWAGQGRHLPAQSEHTRLPVSVYKGITNWGTARMLNRDHIWLVVNCNWEIVPLKVKVVPSVLWRCWLGSRNGIRSVKTEWWGTGMIICLERGANDLRTVQLMPLPPHHLWLQ